MGGKRSQKHMLDEIKTDTIDFRYEDWTVEELL